MYTMEPQNDKSGSILLRAMPKSVSTTLILEQMRHCEGSAASHLWLGLDVAAYGSEGRRSRLLAATTSTPDSCWKLGDVTA
mmetsp:Transcript_46757/g.120514  ORF Transcript_46757/g.120514 Transcript_46757/m.120514 type:complete len:81 (-) Transcript_46757:1160-1402(-)